MYEHSPAAEPAAPAGSFYPHPGYALQAFHPYHRGPSPLSQQQVQQQHPAGAGQQVQIKGKRKRASPQQLEVLNKVFASTSFPSTEVRNSLAHELGMTPRTVQIWFQNKRQASRQRDGHHSRNTKSMATSAANMNSFDRQYSKSQSPADGASIPPPTAAAASISPFAASVPAPGPSPLTRLPLPAAMADAAAAGPAARNARPVSWCVQTSSAADAYGRPGKARADTTASSRPEYAHTRNDQWFADDTPARLDYLYDHSSRVVLVSQHSRPKQLVADRMAA
ncbi:Short stature homeobox protein 2, partial [Coemansia biformis]